MKLPHWIYQPKKKKRHHSPTDSFKPVKALNKKQSPWQGQSQAPKLAKTVVVTRAIITLYSKAEIIAMINYLQKRPEKFTIAIAHGDEELTVLEPGSRKLPSLIDDLRSFNKNKDYKKLLELGIERDKAAILNSTHSVDLFHHLHQGMVAYGRDYLQNEFCLTPKIGFQMLTAEQKEAILAESSMEEDDSNKAKKPFDLWLATTDLSRLGESSLLEECYRDKAKVKKITERLKSMAREGDDLSRVDWSAIVRCFTSCSAETMLEILKAQLIPAAKIDSLYYYCQIGFRDNVEGIKLILSADFYLKDSVTPHLLGGCFQGLYLVGINLDLYLQADYCHSNKIDSSILYCIASQKKYAKKILAPDFHLAGKINISVLEKIACHKELAEKMLVPDFYLAGKIKHYVLEEIARHKELAEKMLEPGSGFNEVFFPYALIKLAKEEELAERMLEPDFLLANKLNGKVLAAIAQHKELAERMLAPDFLLANKLNDEVLAEIAQHKELAERMLAPDFRLANKLNSNVLAVIAIHKELAEKILEPDFHLRGVIDWFVVSYGLMRHQSCWLKLLARPDLLEHVNFFKIKKPSQEVLRRLLMLCDTAKALLPADHSFLVKLKRYHLKWFKQYYAELPPEQFAELLANKTNEMTAPDLAQFALVETGVVNSARIASAFRNFNKADNLELIVDFQFSLVEALQSLANDRSTFISGQWMSAYSTFNPQSNALYVNTNVSDEESQQLLGATSPNSYKMKQVGEALNFTAEALCLRTGLLSYSFTKNPATLTKKVVNAVNSLERAGAIQFNLLNQAAVERIREAANDEFHYYQLSKPLLAGKWTRLFSVDSRESLQGVCGKARNIIIKKGDDGFLYAFSTTAVELTYVLKAPTRKAFCPKELRDIIEAYQKNSNFARYQEAPSLEESGSYEAWLNTIRKGHLGSCWQRCLAMQHYLRNLTSVLQPDLARQVRIIRINNSHTQLAIGDALFELGGKPAPVVYQNNSQLRCHPPKPLIDHAHLALAENQTDVGGAGAGADGAGAGASGAGAGAGGARAGAGGAGAGARVSAEAEAKAQAAAGSSINSVIKARTAINKIKLLRAKRKAKLKKLLLKSLVSTPLTTSSQLNAELNNPENKHLLFESIELDQQANSFIEYARDKGRRCFYLGKEHLVNFKEWFAAIEQENKRVAVVQGGPLAKFLKSITSDERPKPLLIINWDAFTQKERVAFNNLFEQGETAEGLPKATINGLPVAHNLQVVGFCRNFPDDPSFRSRHDALFQLPKLIRSSNYSWADHKKLVDMDASPNWREKLFGAIDLEHNLMKWSCSDLAKQTFSESTCYQLLNVPKEYHAEINVELEQAKARGYFDYHGYQIPIPSSTEFKLIDKPLNFHKFQAVKISYGVVNGQQDRESVLVNAYNFDLLLQDKIVNAGEYTEQPGLLLQAAKQTSCSGAGAGAGAGAGVARQASLNLYLTSELSDSQWYRLLNNAKQNNVRLNIQLAKSVTHPRAIKTDQQPVSAMPTSTEFAKQVFHCNQPEKQLDKLKQAGVITESTTVLSVEDYSFQALFHDISFKLHAGRFSNFQLEKSELLTKKLFRGETVVLKGEFSAELLAHMETLLTQPAYLYINGEKRVVPGKLILLVEEKKLSACSTLQQCKTLNWLADSQREVAFEEQAEPLANQVFYDESDFVFDPVIPEDSEQQAKDFINSRMLALDLAFEKSSLVSLQGKTGVGKNRLIKQIQQAGVARVYRDLDSVDEWAREDFEDQRTKILFIDEANIEDCQYTFLEPLLPGGNKRLYYNQKFYELDERHKVVFASNPENYGGGRSKPKLFNHSELLVMKLGDFPSCYVYENILKPIYQSMEQPLPESEIKVACQQLMNQFHGDGSLMTVRELQQLALNDCLRISQEQTRASTSTSDIRISLTEASSFIPTEHTRAALQRCEQLLAIKALQAQGKLLNDGVGLNCLLLEGVPGIGKTALFEYCLHKNGYVDAEYATESDSQLYYRIDASLSLEEKREIILTAYHGGGIVWIDELNSCCDEGLEKILNNVLTGEDPRTGAHAVNPGFALLASINGADLEGRAILSPAIYGRSQSVQIDRPSLLDVKTILQARSGSATQARELAEDFVELREECSCLNLRTLVKNEGAAQAIYKQKVLARRPASQPSQAGLWRPLPQNELNLRALVGQDQVAPGSS